jgi:hypothetical protein
MSASCQKQTHALQQLLEGLGQILSDDYAEPLSFLLSGERHDLGLRRGWFFW